eukprot:4954462-Prymnesium_polylepis.3
MLVRRANLCSAGCRIAGGSAHQKRRARAPPPRPREQALASSVRALLRPASRSFACGRIRIRAFSQTQRVPLPGLWCTSSPSSQPSRSVVPRCHPHTQPCSSDQRGVCLPRVQDCAQSSPCLRKTEWHGAELVELACSERIAAPTPHARLKAQHEHAARCLDGRALELSVVHQAVLHLRMGSNKHEQQKEDEEDRVCASEKVSPRANTAAWA